MCSASNRERWLEERRNGIGGSDAGAVLGLDPHKAPFAVYADKLGHGDEGDSDFMWWGRELEPLILRRFKEQNPSLFRVSRGGVLLRSRRRPWQLATLDAKQWREGRATPGIIEAKATMFEWEGNIVPPDVYAQAQHQMDVTGFHWGSVVCFNRTTCELREYPVELDPVFVAEMRAIEFGFWRRVIDGEPPPVDGSHSCSAALKRMFPSHTPGAAVELPSSFIGFGERLESVKAEIKKLEGERRELENEFTFAMGDAEFGDLPDGVRYTLRETKRDSYTVKATSYRVLRRKEPKSRGN